MKKQMKGIEMKIKRYLAILLAIIILMVLSTKVQALTIVLDPRTRSR